MNAARSGNLLSAALSAACVGVTVLVGVQLLDRTWRSWLIAVPVAMLWAVSPLFWSQALITEVYALHMLLAALLVWSILAYPRQLWLAAIIAALGMANHLTFALLLPAVAYWLWRTNRRHLLSRAGLLAAAIFVLIAIMLYLRIPLVAAKSQPSPVNWGFADQGDGFWWLVSGRAYRIYFTDQSWSNVGTRITAWARAITLQYTPVGLAFAAVGLAHWDRARPELRTFSLLWVIPVSLYAILYTTRDSFVYLVPVMWMMALWIIAGLDTTTDWAGDKFSIDSNRVAIAIGVFVLMAAVALVVIRMPYQSLRHDNEATVWLQEIINTVEPNSIIVSSSDNETFALWYAAWASGELLDQAPNVMVVNDSLYQFAWYRRLQHELHPEVAGSGGSFAELLRQNLPTRPIYFVEELDTVPTTDQTPSGAVWRYNPELD